VADHAEARTCPHDGTLVTVAGNHNDETLSGVCPVCHTPMQIPNPTFSLAALSPGLVAAHANLTDEQKGELLEIAQGMAAKNAAAPSVVEEPVVSAPAPEFTPFPPEPPRALEV
jgi:hypothetical protein